MGAACKAPRNMENEEWLLGAARKAPEAMEDEEWLLGAARKAPEAFGEQWGGTAASSRRGRASRRRGRQTPQLKPVVAIEAEATAMHVHVPVAELAEVQVLGPPPEVQSKTGGAAKVLMLNKFAALLEDDSDEGGSADVAVAKRLQLTQQAAVLKSDLLIIDTAMSSGSSGAATALIAMRTWAIAELARLEVQLAIVGAS